MAKLERKLSPGRPVPKPFVHPADIVLRRKTRRLAQTAEFATGGEPGDRTELAFATQSEHLQGAIKAVKRVHRGSPNAPATIMESELTNRERRGKAEAKIIVSAIRDDQGQL